MSSNVYGHNERESVDEHKLKQYSYNHRGKLEQVSLTLDAIREKAKLELPDGGEILLERLKEVQQETLKEGKNPLLDEDYIHLIEEVVEKVSPETLQDYQRHNVEFILCPESTRPYVEKSEKDHCKLYVPSNYLYPIQGLILHVLDQILRIEQGPDGAISIPRRAEITVRVFQANEMLGERYGCKIEGYILAENYHKDYYDGIDEAFRNQLINIDTPKEALKEIAHSYAKTKLLEYIKPEKWDVPMILLSTMPGSYLEERSIKERVVASPSFKMAYRTEQPNKIGTEACEILLKELAFRKEMGINTTLMAAVLPNNERTVGKEG